MRGRVKGASDDRLMIIQVRAGGEANRSSVITVKQRADNRMKECLDKKSV